MRRRVPAHPHEHQWHKPRSIGCSEYPSGEKTLTTSGWAVIYCCGWRPVEAVQHVVNLALLHLRNANARTLGQICKALMKRILEGLRDLTFRTKLREISRERPA